MKMRWLAAVLCMSLAGCGSVEVPLTAPGRQAPDEGLLGTWRMLLTDDMGEPAEEDDILLSISRVPGGNLALQDGTPGSPASADDTAELITAEIRGAHYASVGVRGDGGPAIYTVVRYEYVNADRVQLYLASVDRLEDAVRRGWIKGERRPDRHFETMALDANATQLRSFITAHGRKVYVEGGPVLERVSADAPD